MSFANKAPAIKSFLNDQATSLYGLSVTEAITKHICIDCKNPPTLRTPSENTEYYISAICGLCWDSMFNEA